jgi:hypothetical protein
MLKKQVPVRLQDYRFLWVRETENICVNLSKYTKDGTPVEIFTGDTSDMSEYLDFEFYNWVLHQSNTVLGKVELGCWIGVSHSIGQRMSYCWVLPESGIPVSVTAVQRMTNDKRNTDKIKGQMNQNNEAQGPF